MNTPKGWLLGFGLASALAGPTAAQVGYEMTPERIAEAAALPAKEAKPFVIDRCMGRVTCAITTPFLRVAMLARDAKKNYRPFDASGLPDEVLRNEVEVFCPSMTVGGGGRTKHDIASVVNVVITDRGGSNPTQPARTAPVPEEYRNAFGARWEGEGLLATFPTEALRDGREFHIIFDRAVHACSTKGEDMDLKIKLKGLQ